LFSFSIFGLFFAGSFGAVYLCHHVESGECKAVKVFFRGDEKVLLFMFANVRINNI
jgi:hypothetical protein